MSKLTFDEVVVIVRKERERQNLKWGIQHDARHELGDWLAIIRHELYEAKWSLSVEECLVEILHTATVAIACLEQFGVPIAEKELGYDS